MHAYMDVCLVKQRDVTPAQYSRYYIDFGSPKFILYNGRWVVAENAKSLAHLVDVS